MSNTSSKTSGKTALSTQPYKGTRDFYPDDMRIRQWMFNQLRGTLTAHGYLEYDGPMLESFELYASKTSEEIVNEQLYWLIDRGERKLAIRPEMTPTLARMVAAKQNEIPRPIRWFSIPNLWRYERPQRGRLREHWQLNVDVFGGTPLAEDTEICQLITSIMGGFGASPDKKLYEVRLNHRGLTDAIFKTLVELSDEKIPTIGHLLDAAPKMGNDSFKAALEKEGLNPAQIEILLSLLAPDAAEKLKETLGENPHYQHLTNVLASLNELGIGASFRYDPSIMRGFLYYTGMVFEVFDLHPENNRALFGGGRYDDLVGMFNGSPLPGVGFGMGDVTFRNFLESHGLMPNLKTPTGFYIAAFEDHLLIPAQKVARELRQALTEKGAGHVPVLAGLNAEKPRKAFASAEKLGVRGVVFVGPDDVVKGVYPLKDMTTGTQYSGSPLELAQQVSTIFGAAPHMAP